MRIFNFTFILLLVISSNLSAAGSTYSKFGIGEILLPNNTISLSRGSTGISLSSIYYSNRLNPAGINLITKTIFSADTYYNGLYLQDTKANNFLSSIKLYGFDLLIPLSTSKGIALNFGLIPYSVVDYNIKKITVIDNIENDLEYKGDGGLSIAFLGTSYNLIDGLSLGLRLNYLFGNIYHQITQKSGNAQTDITRALKLHNINGTLGLIYSNFGKLIGFDESQKINIGLIFSNNFNLNTEAYRYFDYYYNQKLVTQDSILIQKTVFKVPTAIGFGVSYIYNNRYLFTSDIYLQDWSKSNLTTEMIGNLRQSTRFSFGFELIPYSGKVSQLKKFGLRAGIFYNQSYINVKAININELGFTAGTDFPIFGETRLAIGFEYSTKGDKKIQKDNLYKVSIGIIGTELWFVRPEEE